MTYSPQRVTAVTAAPPPLTDKTFLCAELALPARLAEGRCALHLTDEGFPEQTGVLGTSLKVEQQLRAEQATAAPLPPASFLYPVSAASWVPGPAGCRCLWLESDTLCEVTSASSLAAPVLTVTYAGLSSPGRVRWKSSAGRHSAGPRSQAAACPAPCFTHPVCHLRKGPCK